MDEGKRRIVSGKMDEATYAGITIYDISRYRKKERKLPHSVAGEGELGA